MPENTASPTRLSPKVFTDSVAPFTSFLAEKFPEGICVSDIRDELGRQYVDLVQEGGGVHGIALAGYTYMLEKMNIGFSKMAGTSAGSINTLLLNTVYTTQEAELLQSKGKIQDNNVTYYDTRSEKVLEYLANKNLGDLVDGHPMWKGLILNIYKPTASGINLKSQGRATKRAGIVLAIFLTLLLICSILVALSTGNTGWIRYARWITIVSAIMVAGSLAFIFSRLVLIRLLYKHSERFGINPGKDFEDWIHNDILEENKIATLNQLEQKFKNEQKILNLHYSPLPPAPVAASAQIQRPVIDLSALFERIKNPAIRIEVLIGELRDALFPEEEDTKKLVEASLPAIMAAFEERLRNEERLDIENNEIPVTKELVMVASDITNELKVEFPGMHRMYWGDDFSISPAKYVRASMSVPLFFKPFEVKYNSSQMRTIDLEWQKLVKTAKKTEPALFVDGGLLSNFPINVFYNPDMAIPRKPTFGIKLEYDKLDLSEKIKSLLSFLGKIISTMRFFYDRDFALKHDIYRKTVRSIDTGKVHWLNFNLTDQQKIELFFRGALTATIFLSRHAITESETQDLLAKGKNVNFNGRLFSIYEGSDVSFHTEDCLISNITFEWNHYKRERLLDRISKEKRRRQIKAGASLQMTQTGTALKNVDGIASNSRL